MKKIIILMMITLITLTTSCTNNASHIENNNNDIIIKEGYYQILEVDERLPVFGDGTAYNFNYNLAEDTDIKIELVISEGSKELGIISLNGTRINSGDIDGTFGITVIYSGEGELIWTLNLDGKEAESKTYDFTTQIKGSHGLISESGILCSEGVLVMQQDYDITNSSDNEDDDTIYEVSVELRIYSQKADKIS